MMIVSLSLPFLGWAHRIGSLQDKYIFYISPPMPVGGGGGSARWSSREERWQAIIRQQEPKDGEGKGNSQKVGNSARKGECRVAPGSRYVLGKMVILVL